MPRPDRPVFRLLAGVVLLEAASGLPYGVVTDLVPVWLRVHGVEPAAIGMMTLATLPWTLKALWAPAVDRFGGFRGWMLAGMAGCISTICLLPAVGPKIGRAHV